MCMYIITMIVYSHIKLTLTHLCSFQGFIAELKLSSDIVNVLQMSHDLDIYM